MEGMTERKVMGVRFWVLGIIIYLSFLQAGCFAQMQVSAQIPPQNNSQEQPDEKYTWDFGRSSAGDVLKHAFTLKNESQKTLNIKNVTSSCGCATSQVTKTTLEPGESTDIEVKFNSKGYFGPVQKYIYVNTDGLDNPVIKFIIKTDVVKQKNTEVK